MAWILGRFGNRFAPVYGANYYNIHNLLIISIMEDIFFDYHISQTTALLLIVAFLGTLWVCIVWLAPLRRVRRAIESHNAEAESASAEGFSIDNDNEGCAEGCTEPVSVIVRANDDAEMLSEHLPALLEQKYDPGFEVIVVNEGASPDTSDLVDRLRINHRNLYLTFTPEESRNLSTRKLAITLGVKAAHNRILVLTTGRCAVGSPLWLSRMVRHFTDPAVEVVIGYSVPATDDGRWKRTRTFDHAADSITWLDAALRDKPYRGTEFNLAYTREVFFANKGFSRSLNLLDGDDDVFVNEIAHGGNTAVELSECGRVEECYDNTRLGMKSRRRRHEYTGRLLPRGSRRMMSAGCWALTITVLSAIAAGVTALPNLVPAIVALVIIIAVLVLTALAWRKTINALGGRRLAVTVPFLAMTMPVRNSCRWLRSHRDRNKHHTWR